MELKKVKPKLWAKYRFLRFLVRVRRLWRPVAARLYKKFSGQVADREEGRFAKWLQAAGGLSLSKRKPENLYPYINARSGVKNQFRPMAFLYLILILVIPVMYIRWLFQPYQQDPRYAIHTLTPDVSSGRGDNGLALPDLGASTATVTATPASLELPVTPTPYPTYTPYPTPTPVFSPTPVYELKEFLYSYYDPALGGVNCREWDEINGVCLSTMASGLDWSQWYGRAVACSSEYPLWTIFRVVDPPALAGDWVCLDRGGLIDGTIYLDFLDTSLRLPWNTTIKAYVIYP